MVARTEGERILQSAKGDIAQEVERAKASLREQVAALAVAGAEKILRREVDAKGPSGHPEEPGGRPVSADMAENSTIARPYAHALYDVAAAGDLNAWGTLVEKMAALAANPEMRSAISNPKLTAQQLFEVFSGVLQAPLTGEEKNLVETLIANNRLALLPEIAAQFHDLKNEREGSADAHIFSAFAMSDAEVNNLVADLEKKFKVRLTPTVSLDPSLIGGGEGRYR